MNAPLRPGRILILVTHTCTPAESRKRMEEEALFRSLSYLFVSFRTIRFLDSVEASPGLPRLFSR